MKKMFDLMRIDVITMNGGKNSLKMIFMLMFIFFGVIGFLFSPLIGLYCPLLMGVFFVPMMFQNELKYHSDKLHSLLPIRRRDLVNARFLLTTVLYTALFLIFYLIMLLSLNLKVYYIFFYEDAENMDIIALLVQLSGGSLSELGLFNLMYFAAFSFGLFVMSGSLRKYFKDNKTIDVSLKLHKITKKEIGYLLLILMLLFLLVLIVSGVLPFGSLALIIIQLFIQLAEAANGFMLSAVLVIMAVFSVIYKYICTTLEYEEREL